MRKSSGVLFVLLLVVGFVLGMGVSALAAEKHPEIHHAQHYLAQAKSSLEHAAHDYAGHRVKAIDLINQAEDELRLALESDKH